MKKYVIKMVALLLFTSVAITSCSLQYRQNRAHRYNQDRNNGHDHDHDRYNDRDHHYDPPRHY